MNIFIAGGTSGIGYALALDYLRQGCRVGVCGRDANRVPKNSPTSLIVYEADVCIVLSIETALKSFLNDGEPLDIFINCAGSYAEDVASEISYGAAEHMLKTNILGVVHCFEVARTAMLHQNEGSIVVVASVSGMLDYENSSLYTKTKRSAMHIADAYRRALKPFNISVTTINPGYVDTEKLRSLNQNDLSKKPFLIDVDTAVRNIVEAVRKKEKDVIFPVKMKYLMTFLSYFPSSFLNLIMYKKAKWMKQEQVLGRK